MKHRYGLKIGDIVLIALLLVTAACLFLRPFFTDKAVRAELLVVETGEIRVISLRTDATYEVTTAGGSLTVAVEDGRILVSRADCRDGICLRTPPISRAGQSIVCAPAGVVIRITGEEAMVDGVSG